MIKVITYTIAYILLIISVPSQIKTEEYPLKNGNIKIPGTLTYTDNSKDLIIWVHGSGNGDRDGNSPGAKTKIDYIKQFRNAINKKDIAFYSYDKRNSVLENRKFMPEGNFNDLVDDVKFVITHFKKDKRFTSITLVGHSQGSLVGMLASSNVDKYVSLAGPAGTVDKTLIDQLSAQNKDMGNAARSYIKELKETGTIKEVSPFLASIFAKHNHTFLISWMKYDANKEIAKLNLPILIINGKSDLQVPIEDARSLHQSNPKSKLVIIDKLNHLLKKVENKTENMNSYYQSDAPISEKLVEVITEFVKE